VTTQQHNELLQGWVQETTKSPQKFALLWAGTRDGFQAETFHAKCDNKGPTLTVIQSGERQLFGGFTAVPWTSPETDTPVHDPSAFIFSLTHSTKCAKQLNNNSIVHAKNAGPIFGYNEEYGYDIQVVTNSNKDNNIFNGASTFEIPPGFDVSTFLAGGNDYTVHEIEVYAVSKS
jgi:hypothetical protein